MVENELSGTFHLNGNQHLLLGSEAQQQVNMTSPAQLAALVHAKARKPPERHTFPPAVTPPPPPSNPGVELQGPAPPYAAARTQTSSVSRSPERKEARENRAGAGGGARRRGRRGPRHADNKSVD